MWVFIIMGLVITATFLSFFRDIISAYFLSLETLLYMTILCFFALAFRKLICDYKNRIVKTQKNFSSVSRQNIENNIVSNALLEHIPCAITVISPTMIMQHINQAAIDLTGVTPEVAIGQKCYAVFGTGAICPNCPVEKALRTGAVQQNVKRELTRQDREIFIEQTAIPVFNDDGSIQCVFEVVVDATEKVQLGIKNKLLYEQTVVALAHLIGSRDEYTSSHSHRVRDLAVAIGKQLALAVDVIEEISIAAILHDIGKIGIPEYILNKPDKLSEEEYEIIKRHPTIGYNAIKNIEQLQPVAEAILYHHEMYNGGGYPANKKGAQIPLVARILSIADVYEALTSDRVYREKMNLEQALIIMNNGRGIHFDPHILEAFFEVVIKANKEARYVLINIFKYSKAIS